jgi:hypothetical protein
MNNYLKNEEAGKIDLFGVVIKRIDGKDYEDWAYRTPDQLRDPFQRRSLASCLI